MMMLNQTPIRQFDISNGQLLKTHFFADLCVQAIDYIQEHSTLLVLNSGQHKIYFYNTNTE